MIQMNLFIKQTQRLRKQIYGYQGRKGWWRGERRGVGGLEADLRRGRISSVALPPTRAHKDNTRGLERVGPRSPEQRCAHNTLALRDRPGSE